MSEPKTKKNQASVEEFLRGVDHQQKREDSFAILDLMGEVTGKACLYLKKLEDVDMEVLRKIVKQSVEHITKTNPA